MSGGNDRSGSRVRECIALFGEGKSGMAGPEFVKIPLGNCSPVLNGCAIILAIICKDLEHPYEILVADRDLLDSAIILLVCEGIPRLVIKSE